MSNCSLHIPSGDVVQDTAVHDGGGGAGNSSASSVFVGDKKERLVSVADSRATPQVPWAAPAETLQQSSAAEWAQQQRLGGCDKTAHEEGVAKDVKIKGAQKWNDGGRSALLLDDFFNVQLLEQ